MKYFHRTLKNDSWYCWINSVWSLCKTSICWIYFSFRRRSKDTAAQSDYFATTESLSIIPSIVRYFCLLSVFSSFHCWYHTFIVMDPLVTIHTDLPIRKVLLTSFSIQSFRTSSKGCTTPLHVIVTKEWKCGNLHRTILLDVSGSCDGIGRLVLVAAECNWHHGHRLASHNNGRCGWNTRIDKVYEFVGVLQCLRSSRTRADQNSIVGLYVHRIYCWCAGTGDFTGIMLCDVCQFYGLWWGFYYYETFVLLSLCLLQVVVHFLLLLFNKIAPFTF